MEYRRIFFWRYVAVGLILVLAFGWIAGLIGVALAYWPTLQSAKRTARRINADAIGRAWTRQ